VTVTIRVCTPSEGYDEQQVAAALGEPPLRLSPADLVPASWITVDGRVHATTSSSPDAEAEQPRYARPPEHTAAEGPPPHVPALTGDLSAAGARASRVY
jgi:hypothetical protein